MRTAFVSLLTILCLMLAVAPAMADTLYSNGPYNGTNDAWTINFDFSVSNSYNCAITECGFADFHLVYWDASSTSLLTSVDMALGSTSFGTDYANFQTLTGATNQFLGTNQYGYFLYAAWFSFPSISVPGGRAM